MHYEVVLETGAGKIKYLSKNIEQDDTRLVLSNIIRDIHIDLTKIVSRPFITLRNLNAFSFSLPTITDDADIIINLDKVMSHTINEIPDIKRHIDNVLMNLDLEGHGQRVGRRQRTLERLQHTYDKEQALLDFHNKSQDSMRYKLFPKHYFKKFLGDLSNLDYNIKTINDVQKAWAEKAVTITALTKEMGDTEEVYEQLRRYVKNYTI